MTIVETEAEAVQAWTTLLSPHFDIEPEVPGEHWSGRKVRIDMLLHPRFYWRGGGQRPIGFEIKRPGANEAKLIGQAADYAASTFHSAEGTVRAFVAVYAPHFRTHFCDRGAFLSEQMLGRLGVLMFDIDDHYGLHLRVSGNTAWSERRGTINMNWAAQRKFGSR